MNAIFKSLMFLLGEQIGDYIYFENCIRLYIECNIFGIKKLTRSFYILIQFLFVYMVTGYIDHVTFITFTINYDYVKQISVHKKKCYKVIYYAYGYDIKMTYFV